MPLTRLDNLLSSKTGKYLYVSPDDYNASDALDNRGNSPTRPFLTIQRAFLEVARFSYVPGGNSNDRFDQFSIMLSPGNHYIDNRPGIGTAAAIDAFNYSNGEWNDTSILDLGNENNVLYKFNSTEGGAIIPRGTSLVGMDLRRTQLKPLYVPDPADKDLARTSLFQVTGGCYFWQFTIMDGDLSSNSPLYNSTEQVGKVYIQPNGSPTTGVGVAIPNYSHHKITNFIFATKNELGLLYQKVAKAFSLYQPTIDDPGEFSLRIQENRIVGPLSDSVLIEKIKVNNLTGTGTGTTDITVSTKINHNFFAGQFVAITGINAGNDKLNGVFAVKGFGSINPAKEFTFNVPYTATGLGLVDNSEYTESSTIKLSKDGTNAQVQAEVDSVESASPYVFNVSIRSTWGICGIWADGSRASGFKSMVIAQYTGVSLQKDDRAFIRYDEFSNTWNQANLQDAFSTTPYHIDGTAFWKDDWRNFHVRASEDAFIQCVSIFAVGFADHFLMESGGDMSITNSNSNFGNTSLHTIGYKPFSFNQDKGGYIDSIVPPKKLVETAQDTKNYYTLNVSLSNDNANTNRLYFGIDEVSNPEDRPAASIAGYKLGAKSGEKLYVKLDAISGEAGKQIKSALVTPNGVKKWNSRLSTISPAGTGVDNLAQDAANLIDSNREFIQSEAFGYILEKYPALQDISYVNPNITAETGRYRDASNLIRLNRQQIIDAAYTASGGSIPADTNGTKCKRDIGYIVDAVANDLYSGGNSNIIEATRAYFDGTGALLNNGLAGEVTQSVVAFNAAATSIKSAITNQLLIKDLTITADPATGSNVSVNSCANVRTTVDNLVAVITTALNSSSLSYLPTSNPGPWSFVSETSKCRRDIGYILEAVASDLRLGGNTNVVDAAEAYYTGTQLDYIENEKIETLDAYNYVRDLAIAAMRNWNFTIINASTTNGSPTITVSSTVGITIGMSVVSSNNNIPSTAYVKRIINATQFELGSLNSRFAIGTTVNATSTSSSNTLTFTLDSGIWAASSNLLPVVDNSVLPDNSYPECASVANAISTYFITISTIINNGVNTVTKTPGSVNTNSLSTRGTIFTLTETGGNLPNPHNMETGTPVRLVPKPLNSSVEKSLIRLPKEFDTNTKYYVIAPGRKTFPEDFSSYTQFDGSSASQRSILLATSEENANAGIYIYSPETETVDPNVVIQVHQFVSDVKYDLIKYKTAIASGSNETFETEGPHPFDLPSANTTPQLVFFRGGAQTDITGSVLPTKSATFGGTVLDDDKEFYARIVPSSFDSSKLFVVNSSSFSSNDIVKVGSEYFKIISLVTSGTVSLTVTRSVTTGINGSYASGDIVTKYTIANSATVKTVQEIVDSTETILALNNTTSLAVGDYLKLTNNVDGVNEFVKIIETGVSDLDYDRLYVTLGTSFIAGDTVKVDSEYFRVISVNTTGADYLTVVGAQINSVSTTHNNAATVTKQTIVDSTLVAISDEFIDNTETIITSKFGTINGITYTGFSGFSAGDLVRITNNVDSTSEIVQIISFGSTTNIREAYVKRAQLGTAAVNQPTTTSTVITFTKINISNSATTTTLNQAYPFTLSNAVRVERAQLGTAAVNQPVSSVVTATKQTLTATATTTTLTTEYPKLLSSATNTKFTIHNTHIDAINGTNAVQFSNLGTKFYTYANKRRSVVRFAPEAQLTDNSGNKGSWYINTSTENNEILDRLKLSVYADITGKSRTTDTWFYRTNDERTDSDKVYRLRYVIPKNGNYREPINGFVIKVRTDDTRRLLPQTILLKPVGAAASFASITKNGETLGVSAATTSYDPYFDPYTKETDSKINFSVQSARTKRIGVNDYLELTVFDVGVVDQSLKTEIFTTVKIDPPQGGSGIFNSNISTSTVANTVTWTGYSSGSAYVHAYFSYENNYYMILKGITGTLAFSAFDNTLFTQGSVSTSLQEKPDNGRSDREVYKYTVEGANVYTMTVGDTITIPVSGGGNAQYRISSVTDVDDLNGTYYIFKSERIRKRIKGQQDGIYYLTCVRGDIRPKPSGSGIGNNFKNFKFSQPVSRIYPISTKNDPLWFQVTDEVVNSDSPPRDTTLVDPPQTYAAADNFVHGYVTVNDAKASTTKETILDLVADPGIGFNSFTGANEIKALEGSASAGSESRKISISGDSTYPTKNRLYVELRRPSIARSGNHTFEYLGFGPGNYSTGFPARQQVVLTDKQDYYSQAKRQDAGIVLYTGLNSSGDLYIGNKKINAITGEETLLDAPILEEEDEELGISNALVTTFDDPVTFNNTVTFNYNKVIPETLAVVTLNVPVVITSDTTNTSGGIIKPPLTVVTYSAPSNDIKNDPLNNGEGDITFANNTISFGVWSINTRGAQDYTIRTAKTNSSPNIKLGTGGIQYYSTTQEIINTNQNWGFTPPKSGDILIKGDKVNYTGSIGWIYANDYETKTTTGITPQVASLQSYLNYSIVKVNFNDTLSNLGITPGSQIRITTSSVPLFNSSTSWSIPSTSISIDAAAAGGTAINVSSGYPGPSANYVYISVFPNQAASTALYASSALGSWSFQVSNNIWKEFGVVGAEALRTQTTVYGDYRLGVNTLARSSNTAYLDGYTDSPLENFIKPRSNLDIEGNTFISGKSTAISITGGIATKTLSNIDEALLVGGDSLTTTNTATLRVATTNNGRVGINVSRANLDRTLVIGGNARITGDFKFENDIDIDGGGTTNTADVRTAITTGTFNLLANSGFTGTLNLGNYPSTVDAFARASNLNIATTNNSNLTLNIATSVSNLTSNFATAATNLTLNIGNPSLSSTISKITVGGAYNANTTNSYFEVRNKFARFLGDLTIGSAKTFSQTVSLGTAAGTVNFFSDSGTASKIDFGLNASELTLGGQGGTTNVRNSLTVDASAVVNGNITLDGGTASYSFNGTRNSLGSTISSHIGTASGVPPDKNADLVTVISGFNNTIDAAGAGSWGGPFFQNAIPTYNADDTTPLVSLVGVGSGKQYYLPLLTPPTYQEGDDILIDSTISGTTQHPEIVRVAVGGLKRVITAPYYIIVERQPYGTFLPIKTNHPDATITRKVNVALDATWITAAVDGAGATDVFSLAEFGGLLSVGDYIFASRNTAVIDTNGNVTLAAGTTGEAVKIGTTVGLIVQKFSVTNGAGATKFEISSLTGATTISDAVSLGGLTVYGPLNFVGSCVSTGDARKFKLSNTIGETFSVDMCNGETTITQGILTTDVKALNATATWNSAATTFTGIKLNVTNTASNVASDLIDLQVGGITRLNVKASTGDTYILGDLTVNGNDIKSSTNTALTLSGSNVTVVGDLTVTGNDIKSSTGATVLTLNSPSTATGNDATFADDLTVTGDLTVNGGDFVVNSGGTERFNVNSNGAIDLGGITQYFTPTGGRKWVFITTQSNNQSSAVSLLSNTNYYVIPSGSGSNLILTLPSSPSNGDMIRILDLGGQITYNTQLIIRATNSKSIQGDTTGSTFGMSSGSYTGGGELIINTPNVGLGLVYVGDVDGIGTAIPSNVQGWRLTEI